MQSGQALFTGVIDLWLWLTLIFANFATSTVRLITDPEWLA